MLRGSDYLPLIVGVVCLFLLFLKHIDKLIPAIRKMKAENAAGEADVGTNNEGADGAQTHSESTAEEKAVVSDADSAPAEEAPVESGDSAPAEEAPVENDDSAPAEEEKQ